MHKWNLGIGDPLNLTIASDFRLSKTDYANDQIWEIIIGGGEPPSLVLQTTFGLRCKSMRIFLRFIRQENVYSDPAKFYAPPHLISFFPNYMEFSFSPFQGVEVFSEYWVSDSYTLAGRIRLQNVNVLPEQFRLELCAVLNPIGDGQGMIQMVLSSLQGASGGVYPVLFMDNNPQFGSGPFPALIHNLDLLPDAERIFTWSLASHSSPEASIEAAQRTTSGQWDAEVARIELINESKDLEIITGDPDWDAAFAMAQKTAWNLFFPGNNNLHHPSFTLSRQPDQGFSHRGNGSDHPILWSGHTLQDAYYLANVLLPGGTELIQGIIQNFLETQDETGFIDMKPGLAGQKTHRLAPPLLATLASEVNQYRNDISWLNGIFPALLKFYEIWFSPEHDRDQDGFPEWDHALQTGLEEAPIYDQFHSVSQGSNITTIECPSLAAFLFQEAQSLIKIATVTGHSEAIPNLLNRVKQIQNQLEMSWDPSSNSFFYRDYLTHKTHSTTCFTSFSGSGTFFTKQVLPFPQRLVIAIQFKDENTHPIIVSIDGLCIEEEIIEKIPANRFTWMNGIARVTTNNLYTSVNQLVVQGISEEDNGMLSSIDLGLQDISLFLPLWAGSCSASQAKRMIENSLMEKYLLPYGFPVCPSVMEEENKHDTNVNMFWNLLIGEAMLKFDYINESVDLVTRLMKAVTGSMKQHQSFREFYQATDGQPSGERNHLHGLAPLGLFLRTLGIKILNEKEIILQGFNPFPWPITVQYKGTSITRRSADTVITFSSGQVITITGSKLQRVLLP